MTPTNKQILLVSRPEGAASTSNFRLREVPVPDLQEGQVLVRHHYLSLDPYMRGRMNDAKSYAQPQPLNEVMVGGTAGEVVVSRHPTFKAGDMVVGMGGWQQYSVLNAAQSGMLRKVDAQRIPLSAYLGAVGMPGVTAWYGLTRICAPKPDATVVVSAASGAVGSAVGQLAKVRGCRAVGIAGGADKCRYRTPRNRMPRASYGPDTASTPSPRSTAGSTSSVASAACRSSDASRLGPRSRGRLGRCRRRRTGSRHAARLPHTVFQDTNAHREVGIGVCGSSCRASV